ncbi:MAG: hypothetical protein GF408_02865 [Candidatus Omnitrophica bacterium]|nr:hypothetical protein [Candidatus Omnitrophota bacterium]
MSQILERSGKLKKLILWITWIAVLAGLGLYLSSHSGQLRRMLDLSWWNTGALSLLFVITQVLNGINIKLVMRAGGLELGVWECFHLANITTAANYLPFRGGMVARAVYFRKKYGLSYLDFTDLSMAGVLVLMFTIFSSGAFFILLELVISGRFFPSLFLIFVMLSVLIVIAGILLVFFSKYVRWEKAAKVGKGLRALLRKRALLCKLMFVDLIMVFSIGMRFFVSFRALSVDASPLLSLLCGQAKTAAALLGLIPAGLGISELSAGAVSEVLKAGLEAGVFAGSLDRIVSICTLLVISSYSFIFLLRIKKAGNDE